MTAMRLASHYVIDREIITIGLLNCLQSLST
uniref:Uncharacterized protein n=1 Tax=Tetranychus urticae TaxID=32264 RepID=T1K4K1_TETUR